MIILSKSMPNGALAERHEVTEVSIKADSITAVVTSFAATDALCWQDRVELALDPSESVSLASIQSVLCEDGGYLAGGDVVVDPTPVEVLRKKLVARVDRFRDDAIKGGFTTPAGVVQTDEVSIRNILGAVSRATIATAKDEPFELSWRLADNTAVTLNAAEMMSLGVSVMEFIEAAYQRSWAVKAQIAAGDLEALEAFDVSSAWSSAA